MSRYQLELAIALTASSITSAGIFYLVHRNQDGKIKLLEGETQDPFDVTRPVDFVDGFPIEEASFWSEMRFRKIGLSILLAIGLVLNAIGLGWSNIEGSRRSVTSYALLSLFSLYLFIIAVRAVNQDQQSLHAASILHLTTLLTILTAGFFFLALLPDADAPIPISLRLQLQNTPFPTILWNVTTLLYFVPTVVAYTTRLGPPLHYPPDAIYAGKTVQAITNKDQANVTGIVDCSPWSYLMFSYTTKVVMLGNVADSLEIGDLPIVPSLVRASVNYISMRKAFQTMNLRFRSWSPTPGSGWALGWRLLVVNKGAFLVQFFLAITCAVLFYVPPYFLSKIVTYTELDPERKDRRWGWFYCAVLFLSSCGTYIVTSQLWSISTTVLQVNLKIQLNTLLFGKTLVRKDVASSTAKKAEENKKGTEEEQSKSDEEEDFSSKAQVFNLMTVDVDRLSEFAWHLFALVDSPMEIFIGTIFLYSLLGVSCFFGLAVTCLFLPMNHWAGKVVVGTQDKLMKARDERMAMMNEVLGAIRMLKFMAWERSFESRVLKIREKELRYQRLTYTIEVLFNAIWNSSPILVTLVSFWHFTVIRKQDLTPTIAFTSIIVFNELKFALNALPETFINMLQCFVSMRRIEKYMLSREVAPVLPLSEQSHTIAFQSCTVTWPQDRSRSSATPSLPGSTASTPRHKFQLVDLTLQFPPGEMSLICGKLGSGKTLLLLALLGEADILAGQMLCPRSPPDALASFATIDPKEEWIVPGICAYVPQAAWLRNASIKENILFSLPYDETRYLKTLEACALLSDLRILEDGDESEIGERGVNLSGGQKARVSLARAVYSRASILFLDDVLSAVDAHTAHHLYHQCLKGELMKDRTLILVSHHVQLCAPGATFVVALENGRLQFQGNHEDFQSSPIFNTLIQSQNTAGGDEKEEATVEHSLDPTVVDVEAESETSTVANAPGTTTLDRKPPRKVVEEETRAVGRVQRAVWETYFKACGQYPYWTLFALIFGIATLAPVVENTWLKTWSHAVLDKDGRRGPTFYLTIYALVTLAGVIVTTLRWFVLYTGSIHASTVLYQRLLETVLFAQIRFHDTVSRGRVLNRFGKDFEGIDSSLSDNFGRTTIYFLSVLATLTTISVVGGLPFLFAAIFLAFMYFSTAKVYSQTSRDMRRLDSVTRSPLYSIYGETIAGVTILRAFGASTKFLRDMIRCVDTNINPFYWMWGVNRWLSIRFNIISSAILGVTAVVAVLNPRIDASLAGLALTFASSISGDFLFMVRRFVSLEQSMVALERVKEYSDLVREPPEYLEPRPPQSWPEKGEIKCEDLVIRYAPELPNVLHELRFEIRPGEKVACVGRTGSGKSTLALSFFRFVEATEGRILVDGIDIAKVGLTDLRSKLTIIPQDPTILSGTLRSTLDVFDEYQDREIFEALRRVHLIPSDRTEEDEDTLNVNVFRNLDSPVSEGGENFSTGEKQLLCMARAILKRSKVLVMDEATASVDYATDELISKTIRQEFADSTIITIAHRLRTVIDYDRVMVLEQGKIVEFASPRVLLEDQTSKFYGLCKATGREEFSMLKRLASTASSFEEAI